MREIIQKARKERTIYGCDFCKRTNVRKATMARHERVCYHNPDRECPICDGSGRIVEWEGHYKIQDDACPGCETWKSIHEAEDSWALHQQERQEMATET